MRRFVSGLVLITALPVASMAQDNEPRGELLSAFFGLNDSRQIRIRTLPICRGQSRGIPGDDGMPVIFSHEVDAATLDAADFQVTTRSGEAHSADCVTLRPADDAGELRTALLVGEFGSQEDQPARVEIVGEIRSLDGSVNFLNAQVAVTPLENGPSLVLAENLPPEQWTLDADGECPSEGLVSVVRAVWAGGVTKPGGDEIDAREMGLYRVTLHQPDGSVETATPFAVGDLGDNDNNHDLCLDARGDPISVFFPAGALTDPNEDLNPDTLIALPANRLE
ncbi:hypothetical protein [Maricaulis sp.]|uniref:hypothetical protein n=1 Tax=Maricaulis sp. TaxID=1486257 RepID=UPI0026241A2B|nr:hypothetical protein [Maricaulis sp.]